MKHKQLIFLFLCNCLPPFVGMGLFPILPFYATQFGATPTIVGVVYAAMYVASMAGTMLTSWLAGRISRKLLFVGAGVLAVPALALLGQATALWHVMALTAVCWFCGAVTLTLISVFTGLLAGAGSRGRSFSLMFLAFPLGGVVGSTVVGQLVAHYGYAPMFALLSAIWTILPLMGLLGIRDQAAAPAPSLARVIAPAPPLLGSFGRLMLATLLAAAAANISRLGTSLSMQALLFDPGTVASTTAVSGLATIPFMLLIGTLADRIGPRHCLLLAYALAISAAMALGMATQLWHFWLAASLAFIAWCTNGSMAAAYAASMLPPDQLSRNLPRLNIIDSVASILGFACTGYVLDMLGPGSLYLGAVVLGVVAANILGLSLRRPRPSILHSAPNAATPATSGQASAVEVI